MNIRHSFVITLFFFGTSVFAQSGIDLANNMIAKIRSMKTLQCTFESQERVLGKMFSERNNFKINTSPFKTYFKQDIPVKGLEGLYITGENDGKAKINPNAFPWVTLNLDPEGELMMKNQHHPIFHAGYSYVAEVLDMLIKKYQSKTDRLILNKGIINYQDQEVIVLECNNPFYKIQNLTLTNAASPFEIGKRMYINYFSILEENPGLKAFSAISAGKTIKIPSDYASKMTIYLHKTQLYPVYIRISDTRGVFEEYKFTNIVWNPAFKADDFSEENPKYNF